jgi:hypothetical protein
MPITRNSDGTITWGLTPEAVPAFAGVLPRLYIRAIDTPPLPKNPWLDLIRARRLERNSSDGTVSRQVQGTPILLYRPGGLLYKPTTLV